MLIAAHQYVLAALVRQMARRMFCTLARGAMVAALALLGAAAGICAAVAVVLVIYSVLDFFTQLLFACGFGC